MPVEIESFTTEVTLLDQESLLSARQMESLIQEIMRRIERAQRAEEFAKQNSSFEQLAMQRR